MSTGFTTTLTMFTVWRNHNPQEELRTTPKIIQKKQQP